MKYLMVGWLACASMQAEEISPLLHRVNDWQVAHPRMKPDNRNWERGTWYTGVMAAYRATGDKKCLAYMHDFCWDVHAELFDKDDGLFYRDKRFIGQQTKNGKKVFWSRGNGWVLGGIVRILEYLPEDDPQRPRYVELLKTMSAAIAKRQGADGLWRPNLDDSDDVALPESSGTGFFCYGLAWGINRGLLDRETYWPVVKKAWAGLVESVSPEGQVQWGQPVGDRPVNLQQTQTHEYVTGTFLLAGSEMLKLSK